jgi:hypothetical protein
MKKTVRFIVGGFVIAAFSLLLIHSAQADYLIRPIPDETDNQELRTKNNELITNNYRPSVTFGQLLNRTPTPTQISEAKVLGTSKVRDFLARLEEMKRQSMEEFTANNKQRITFNKELRTTNDELITNNLSPTPFIPVPTLIAAVNEIASNNTTVANQQSVTANTGEITDNPIKTTYTIAILGDSMVDTLGNDLPHLKTILKQTFPNYSFALLNYGQGATDLENGLYRLTNATKYLERVFPPLLSYKPDILVVESFAYNHWSGQSFDLDRQWLTFAKIIDKVKEVSPDTKIILAATIGPNSNTYGDGKLNWPQHLKWDAALVTRAYLQNLINFATSEKYPLADAYNPSIGSDGNGLAAYINQGDHLHPSDAGKQLFSQKIVETIKNNKLIK